MWLLGLADVREEGTLAEASRHVNESEIQRDLKSSKFLLWNPESWDLESGMSSRNPESH